MSPAPFSRSPDLKLLREEGYFVQIVGGYLVMREVPFVNSKREVKWGTLVSPLALAGDVTQPLVPDGLSHTVSWTGEYPCDASGNPINAIRNQDQTQDLGHGLIAKHRFSSKPDGGYRDYHHKMTTYAAILSGPAAMVQPGVSLRPFRSPNEEDDSVFNYPETASDRVGIGALTQRLKGERVAIVGLGGTGSYILDHVAKTPVDEIRLIDGDDFLTHNAFRAPGAPTIEELRDVLKKVDYLKCIYGRMHRRITAHPVPVSEGNLEVLDGITFAFLSMDAGPAKRALIAKLEDIGASFIDVGMGLQLDGGTLGGILRTTASTPAQRAHVHAGRVPFEGGGADDLYATNIQVSDLNALNAVMATIKWKKLRGFYRDLDGEHHSLYTTDSNHISNSEVAEDA